LIIRLSRLWLPLGYQLDAAGTSYSMNLRL
jgi:hypothetical protein